MDRRGEKSFDMPLQDLGEPDFLWWEPLLDVLGEDYPFDYFPEEGCPGFHKWIVHQAAGGSLLPDPSDFHHEIQHGFVYGHEDEGCYGAEVHFTGKMLDGTVFASSRENGPAPLMFIPTEGDVMLGFILAISTMKVGEKAVYTIPAELAVTKSGYPATIPWNIPLNQALRFDIELISLTTDVLNDKGLLKMITKFGTGNEHPCDLDEVSVNYHTYLKDGTTLVCKSEGVEFSIAEGFFCRAFAHAVRTMTEGEEAVLIIKPEYGFGERGRPAIGNEAAVPPDATLHVNLQLVTWTTMRYIGNSREILMRTPHKEDNHIPLVKIDNGAVVKVRLIGKLQDGTVFDRRGHDGVEPFEFTIGQEDVIPGLHEAVMAMEREVASVIIPPQHALGTVGSNQYQLAVVPPNSVVIYDIELLSVDGKSCFKLTFRNLSCASRRLKHGHKPRDQGSSFFPLLPAARPRENASQSPVSSAPRSAGGESPATAAATPALGSSSAATAKEDQSSASTAKTRNTIFSRMFSGSIS